MALKSKRNIQTKDNNIIKLNPYENAENVLELMSQICSATSTVNIDIFQKEIYDALNDKVGEYSLKQFISEHRKKFKNIDFEYDLMRYCKQIELSLEGRENTTHTKIVVAGGFSSGKSSFLNKITGSKSLLPTGVEPVSVVKTYLYCSRSNQSIIVKGVNLKNVLVNLNTGVLQAIQHSKKSNIYLASVLDKLFVELPAEKLDGIVFIDTPGYNNSDKVNVSNGKTDKQTAEKALKEGDVLFWLIDCERGTTVSDDISMIRKFRGKKVFIFNKADKKGKKECRKIVDNAAQTIFKEFNADEIIDILAYSTLDNEIYYSFMNKNLTEIFDEAKAAGKDMNELSRNYHIISQLFDDEISESHNRIEKTSKEYKTLVEEKNDYQKAYLELINSKESDDSTFISELEDINKVQNFINRVEWDIYYEDAEEVKEYLNSNLYSVKKNICRNDEKTYEGREFAIEKYNNLCENAKENCKKAVIEKENSERTIKSMKKYKEVFMKALKNGIEKYQQNHQARTLLNGNTIPDVFECIEKNDYRKFLRSFEEGVDLSECNQDGYNPLTLSVMNGNNEMVMFLLNHGANPYLLDNRGYNAFHTAVENQFKDICALLLDKDSNLIKTKTSKGESVVQLAQKPTFSKWMENKINKLI